MRVQGALSQLELCYRDPTYMYIVIIIIIIIITIVTTQEWPVIVALLLLAQRKCLVGTTKLSHNAGSEFCGGSDLTQVSLDAITGLPGTRRPVCPCERPMDGRLQGRLTNWSRLTASESWSVVAVAWCCTGSAARIPCSAAGRSLILRPCIDPSTVKRAQGRSIST
jgi:hypothetical protein